MLVAIYIILTLQILSVSGLILFAIYLNKSNEKYKTLKSNLQDSIKRIIIDKIELENKFKNVQSEKNNYPDLYLN